MRKTAKIYINKIFEYNDAIKNGDVTVGKYIKTLYEILTSGIKSGEYVFDAKRANKAIVFIENFCHHSEGRCDLLKLQLWQQAAVSAIFGIMRKDNPDIRQFREVVLIVARKNGKTLFAAAIMAYMAFMDGEYGAKLYCLAPKLDQSDLCYDAFYQITQSDQELKELSQKRRSDIYIKSYNTKIKQIAFNSKKSDGFNPHFVLCDELEAWAGDQGLKQYNAMKSGTGARRQSLVMSTATAGFINDGIYDSLIRRSTSFLKNHMSGKATEQRLLPLLYMIDDVDKYDTKEELKKSNPNLDVSVPWDFYTNEIAIAHIDAASRAEFLTKYCNIKQNSSVAWLEYQDVERAVTIDTETGDPIHLKLEDFRGCYCVGGIDLSMTTDLTAVSLVIEKEGREYLYTQFYMPRERYNKAINEEQVPYNIYEQQGFLQLSGDHQVDYHDAFNFFCDLPRKYKIYPLVIGYDRYSAAYLTQDLKSAGFKMDDVYQGTNLTPILHQFEGNLKDHKIEIGDNGLLESHFLNIAVDLNYDDHRMKPVKLKRELHIDGAASVFDALAVKSKYYDQYGHQFENKPTT